MPSANQPMCLRCQQILNNIARTLRNNIYFQKSFILISYLYNMVVKPSAKFLIPHSKNKETQWWKLAVDGNLWFDFNYKITHAKRNQRFHLKNFCSHSHLSTIKRSLRKLMNTFERAQRKKKETKLFSVFYKVFFFSSNSDENEQLAAK